ncbi:hypothetical protein ALC53_10770, partial [Atta colombica]
TINHAINFINPESGVHHKNHYSNHEHYLAKFMFKKRYDFNDKIPQFFKLMSSIK